ncbi:hypothetical protein FPZ12_011130 [Amycolatopsis acidicola]|uniref:Uncharacterized protein n=1 Tax=Amycolatopsis acidicola TaxID=2596893 RepID=A0A5N0VD70_9PSEU|nr:hypothetical protein [Amycolatopsis acidicola]KAA9162602.1 hypothetical protein FPZ12_011130 [Amycolatopsis acidicola]
MTAISLTPQQVIFGIGLFCILVGARRMGRRRRSKAEVEVRAVSLAGRVTFTAALIVAVQWVVIAEVGGVWPVLVVLAVPALVAAYTIIRATTVTTQEFPRRRGGRR